MNRREFMKVGAAAIAAVSLPVVAGGKEPVDDGPFFMSIDNIRFIESPPLRDRLKYVPHKYYYDRENPEVTGRPVVTHIGREIEPGVITSLDIYGDYTRAEAIELFERSLE